MIAMLVTACLIAVIAGIFLRSMIHAILLIGLVATIFFVSCYAFRISPRALLTEGVQHGQHELRMHRREIDRQFRGYL